MTVRIYVRAMLASYNATVIQGRQLDFVDCDLTSGRIVGKGVEYVTNGKYQSDIMRVRKGVRMRKGDWVKLCRELKRQSSSLR